MSRPAEERTVVLGAEHDDDLRRVLKDVLGGIGAVGRIHDWSVAGSQELERVEIEIAGEHLVLEAETFLGLSLRGPRQLVDRVVALTEAERGRARR